MSPPLDRSVFLRPIAHRGLHAVAHGIIENTEPAFTAAMARSYGVECDLRPSADGDAVVFHDATLDRLIDASGPVDALTVVELKRLRHRGSGALLLDLAAFFELIGGRVPILAEVKSDWERPNATFLERLTALGAAYRGPLAFMSFDPAVLMALKHLAPTIPRGIISANSDAARWNSPAIDDARAYRLSHLLESGAADPSLVAYEVGALPTPVTRYVREVQRLPLFAWTVRTASERAHAALHADAMIFEDILAPGELAPM